MNFQTLPCYFVHPSLPGLNGHCVFLPAFFCLRGSVAGPYFPAPGENGLSPMVPSVLIAAEIDLGGGLAFQNQLKDLFNYFAGPILFDTKKGCEY